MRKIIVALLLPLCSFAQKTNVSFLARSYSEFVNPRPDSAILDIFANSSGNKIVVKKRDKKDAIAIGEVWGFRPRDGESRRVYGSKIYTVKQADTLSVYERHITMYKARKRQFYFSVGLNGAIHKLSTEELNSVFGAESKFIKMLKSDLKWHQDYESYDKESGAYRIVNIFKKSLLQ